MLLDETLLTEANFLNREDLDEFVAVGAEDLADPAQKKWFVKMLTGALVNSAVDARRATPADMPENPPAWMKKAPPGTAFDVFKPAPETIETIKSVIAYLNANPKALTPRSTWDSVVKLAAEASRNFFIYDRHKVTTTREGSEIVYTIEPTPEVLAQWPQAITIKVHVKASSGQVKQVDGYVVNADNSTELRNAGYMLLRDKGVGFLQGCAKLCDLSGGYAAYLTVTDGARDMSGVLMKNCVGGGGYDTGCSVYVIFNPTQLDMQVCAQFQNGRWTSQVLTVGNQAPSGLSKKLFTEFDQKPEARVQKLDLVGGGAKLSTQLADGDEIAGALSLEGMQIDALPGNLRVTGDLVVKGSSVTELPSGLTVGGTLDIRDTDIQVLPQDAKFGKLRATFGRISHEEVCRYVADVLHAKVATTQAYKDWLNNDPVLGPMSPEERMKTHWVLNNVKRIYDKALAADWRNLPAAKDKDTDVRQMLHAIYA